MGETPYLFLDARYEKVRLEGRIVDCAVLIAVGIEASGKRRVLGCEVATSEAEINWRRFLESLLARGLKGVTLIIVTHDAELAAKCDMIVNIKDGKIESVEQKKAQPTARKVVQ